MILGRKSGISGNRYAATAVILPRPRFGLCRMGATAVRLPRPRFALCEFLLAKESATAVVLPRSRFGPCCHLRHLGKIAISFDSQLRSL